MKKIIYILLIIFVFINFTSCNSEISKQPVLVKTGFYMDTFISISIYDKKVDEAILDDAFDYVDELEDLLSRYVETSDINRINMMAGSGYVKVDLRTLELLEQCIYYCKLTNGAFDITLGSLIDLWDINSGKKNIPSELEIEKAKQDIGYKNILIDKDNCSVKLKEKGIIIDLGAVAKGYISEMTKNFLISKGIKSAIMDFGGNIILIGESYRGINYKVGIQSPFDDRGDYLAVVQSNRNAFVSSGTYERYFIGIDGKRYHHILDPATGMPAQNGLSQVSIICDNATVADILSTGIFVMGIEEGENLIEQLDGIDAIFITDNKEIIITKNIKNEVEIL